MVMISGKINLNLELLGDKQRYCDEVKDVNQGIIFLLNEKYN